MASPDLAAQDVISAFGGFHCHGLVTAPRADQWPPAGKRRDDLSRSASIAAFAGCHA